MSKRMEKALTDVGGVYKHPQAICDDTGLNRAQKIKLLKQWEYDLRELQVAAEENMTGPGMGQNAELLRSVRDCLGQLGADEDLELAGASKQGGA
jgi:ribosomal protein S13